MLLRRQLVVSAIAVCISFGLAGGILANPDPPSWGAFKLADFSGIYLTPSLETDVLTYTLSLGADPTMTYNSVTYDVKWVTAYFVVSQDDTTPFSADHNGTFPLDWTWETNPTGAPLVAGWHDGNNTLNPGSSLTLAFGSLNITGNAVLSGLHVGYQTEGGIVTDWYKGALIPEPSSPLLLLSGLGGLAGWVRRRVR
jgi:hypothetical protein